MEYEFCGLTGAYNLIIVLCRHYGAIGIATAASVGQRLWLAYCLDSSTRRRGLDAVPTCGRLRPEIQGGAIVVGTS